jgi:hypothetical protein
MSTSVLVNDKVQIKVKFVDNNPVTGEQVNVSPATVTVSVKDYLNALVDSAKYPLTQVSGYEYYIEFTPTTPGKYTVEFVGILQDSSTIIVKQVLYVNDTDSKYKPSVTLKADETISFAADISPLYLDPEEVLYFFPDASLLEVGELIHHYSMEIKQMFRLQELDDGSTLNFTLSEYIKASACCELSRSYGYGGDDELSLKLADLSITNRTNPRQSVNRGNAVTWCQIAAALRKEVAASRIGMRAVIPKGLPSQKVSSSGLNFDPLTGTVIYPLTGAVIYLPGRDQYGSVMNDTFQGGPIPTRGLKQYD